MFISTDLHSLNHCKEKNRFLQVDSINSWILLFRRDRKVFSWFSLVRKKSSLKYRRILQKEEMIQESDIEKLVRFSNGLSDAEEIRYIYSLFTEKEDSDELMYVSILPSRSFDFQL